MTAPSSMFCEHKRLRTGCPKCRPPPPPPKPRATKAPSRASPASKPASASNEPAPVRPTGPGKPLMAKRKPRNRAISAEESKQAEAWWVKGRKL